MDHFHAKDGQLWCEQVPLAALAQQVGTPAYVYSAATFREHLRRIRAAFSSMRPLVCYAVKANGNLALLELARKAGAGFDIVSEGELRRVLAVGADPRKVVFSGVGKTDDEMSFALQQGILMFNVESEEEVDALEAVAARRGQRAGVAIRVNPDVDPKTHRYISTGKKETKFGVDIERGAALARRVMASRSLRLKGVQCHIGSQITTAAPYRAAVEKVARLALALRKQAPSLAWLDMGGGFGIYYKDESAPALEEYARAIGPIVRGTGLKLVLEPGRVVVGNAGVLLTRVLFNKQGGEKRFVIVDAGMNDLIRPSLYGGWHRIWPVVGPPPPPLGTVPAFPEADVVGPVCESGDFLAQERPLPPVRRGEVLAVMSAGAYGFSMASNYNDRRRPPEVLVDGDRWSVVRRRESYRDLVRLDQPHAPRRTLPGRPARAAKGAR
ncbi:MAG: diaminopimelate decarboxylase [Planctomycetia bacterium]